MTPEICPTCGADVPPRARACPECGADESTGWSEEGRLSSLDLPDDSFDYDDYVQREFGEEKPKRMIPRGLRPIWWLVAVVLIAMAVIAWILRLF